MNFNTRLLHGSMANKYPERATLPPVAQVSAFTYETAEEQEKVFSHRSMGYAYSRIGNPTVAAFEQRMKELEGGAGAVACSSGMAACTNTFLALLSPGDEVIAGGGLYGGTLDLMGDLSYLGIRVHFVPELLPEAVEPLITERTKLVFGELISNPALTVLDLPALAECVHAHQLPLVIDATTATPYLANALSLGADIVIHSSSKYINGGGNSISGVIIDGGRFSWDFTRYPTLERYRKYGKAAFQIKLRDDIWENTGGCLAPFNAYLNIVGIETLGLRMQRICENARELSDHLSGLPAVTEVRYPTLPDSPYRTIAERDFRGLGGGIVTFRCGSKENAFALLNHLKVALIASNIGDVRTLVVHPASTLFIKSAEEQRNAAGVYPDTIRVSVGIEDIDDLKEDFTQAAEACS